MKKIKSRAPRAKEPKALSSEQRKERLALIADNTLSYFREIAGAAQQLLDEASPSEPTTLASINTFTDLPAVRELSGHREQTLRRLVQLRQEPAIARLVLSDDEGKQQVCFITAGETLPKKVRPELSASYLSEIGRLASAPIGRDHEIVVGGKTRVYEVLERAELRPRFSEREWDSIDSVLRGQSYGPITVRSLKELRRIAPEATDVLEKLLAEERASENVLDGLRRSVITRIGLRNQRILDEYQDAIFRLSIDSRLVILGPPGTGKTTTLIKRLGQKISREYLRPGELAVVRRTIAGENGHPQSWLMFTPTELLQLYVKEAFNRENIAAPDTRVQTWEHFHRGIARNDLGILRTAGSGGSLILRDNLPSLRDTVLANQISWFEHFETHQAETFWSELNTDAKALAKNADASISQVGIRLGAIVNASRDPAAQFVAIDALADELQTLTTRLRRETDGKIRTALAKEFGKNAKLLPNLVGFVAGLSDTADDPDEIDLEDDEDLRQVRLGGREAAFEAYTKAMRAQARSVLSGRALNRQSQNGKIVEWLGVHAMSRDELLPIGESLNVLRSARRFINPVRRYVGGIPGRYRRYRREQQAQGQWYSPEGFAGADLHPLELDVVLLAMLRSGRALLQDSRIMLRLDQGPFAILASIRNLFRTPIIVDEATDFSPIQLACMASLCDPASRSFLACGDFNQRITRWGSRSTDELKWVFPDFNIQSVRTTYRHTRLLNEFARHVAMLSSDEIHLSELPPDLENEGVKPMLGKGLAGHESLASWLADRIIEIEHFAQTMPSIAVLVNDESDVSPLTVALGAALADRNIRVEACLLGKSVGQESDVRVFDVQHIKGLEFEAVFFVGIDDLAKRLPDLFDKFLYVGSTRASFYLGLTIKGEALPKKLAKLEGLLEVR